MLEYFISSFLTGAVYSFILFLVSMLIYYIMRR